MLTNGELGLPSTPFFNGRQNNISEWTERAIGRGVKSEARDSGSYLINRYLWYGRLIGDAESFSLAWLAQKTRATRGEVARYLKEMIDDRLLPASAMDEEAQTCFLTEAARRNRHTDLSLDEGGRERAHATPPSKMTFQEKVAARNRAEAEAAAKMKETASAPQIASASAAGTLTSSTAHVASGTGAAPASTGAYATGADVHAVGRTGPTSATSDAYAASETGTAPPTSGMRAATGANAMPAPAPLFAAGDELTTNSDAVAQFSQLVRAYNDALPDAEISAALDETARALDMLAGAVRHEPAQDRRLHKIVSYYSPQMKTLLQTYRSLYENAQDAEKAERIREDILDGVKLFNQALGNMMDQMLLDTELSVSTDLSVMRAMLAQDGMLDSAFDTKKSTGT